MRERVTSPLHALIPIVLLLAVSACVLPSPKALEPVDWVDQQVERLSVTGKGAWARLTNKPLLIGEYTIQRSSAWSGFGISTETSDSLEIDLGLDTDNSKQITAGTSSTVNEGSFDFRLSSAAGELAQVRCREYLKSTNQQIGGTNSNGDSSWGVSRNTGYKASLTCKSRSLSSDWPLWTMNLETFEAAPFKGSLSVDGSVFEVAGSEATSVGSTGLTSSYEVRQGNSVLALVDLNGDGQLSITMPASKMNYSSFVGAAAVLMFANDPLEEE